MEEQTKKQRSGEKEKEKEIEVLKEEYKNQTNEQTRELIGAQTAISTLLKENDELKEIQKKDKVQMEED